MVLENSNFPDVQFSTYADKVHSVDGWVRKVTEIADVIYGWSLRKRADLFQHVLKRTRSGCGGSQRGKMRRD